MNWYLWAYPDTGAGWIGVGWFQGSFQRRTSPNDYSDLNGVIQNFPADDSGWWYAQPQPSPGTGTITPDQWGRYEISQWDPKLPGMKRTITQARLLCYRAKQC